MKFTIECDISPEEALELMEGTGTTVQKQVVEQVTNAIAKAAMDQAPAIDYMNWWKNFTTTKAP